MSMFDSEISYRIVGGRCRAQGIFMRYAMLIFVAAFLILPARECLADPGAYPPNWPWHGVVMEGMVTPDDVGRLAGYGANAAAILLQPRAYAASHHVSPDQAWQTLLAYADTTLDACRTYRMTCILSVSQIPTDPALGISQASPAFWNDPTRLAEATKIAGSLAQHFHGRGAELGAYELLNEPVMQDGSRSVFPPTLPMVIRSIVSEIRKYDANRFIGVALPMGALPGGYVGFQPLADRRIVYTAHMYMPYEYSHQGIESWPKRGAAYPGWIGAKYWDVDALEKYMSPLISFKSRYNVPVWIGEFSALDWAPNAPQYLSDLVRVFDRNGFGWTYYSINGSHGWNPSCDASFDAQKCGMGDNTPKWQILKSAFAGSRKML